MNPEWAAPGIEVDLVESGLLWLINTSVLWPRGFALAVGANGVMFLVGDGSEPIRTDDATMDDRFERVNRLLSKAAS